MLSFKYDLQTENLTTNYVQGQVVAQAEPIGPPLTLDQVSTDALLPDDKAPPVQTFPLAQTERSAVLRYNGDPTSHIHYSVAAYDSDFSTFGHSFDPRAGFVWTPTGNTAVRASVGTTFQTPQLSELLVPPAADRVPIGGDRLYRQSKPAARPCDRFRSWHGADPRKVAAPSASGHGSLPNESPLAVESDQSYTDTALSDETKSRRPARSACR